MTLSVLRWYNVKCEENEILGRCMERQLNNSFRTKLNWNNGRSLGQLCREEQLKPICWLTKVVIVLEIVLSKAARVL